MQLRIEERKKEKLYYKLAYSKKKSNMVVLVAKSLTTLATPWIAAYQDLPWIFHTRIMEWVAIYFSEVSPLQGLDLGLIY